MIATVTPIPGTIHRPHTQIGDLQKGDVVQIDPETAVNKGFSACFGVVDEVKPFGAQLAIMVPIDRRNSEVAYYRARFEEMVKIGHAEWHPK